MEAVLMKAAGGPEVLEPGVLPKPEIQAPTEVRVRLMAMGINPLDTKLRQRGTFSGQLPAVLGCDGAGVVEAVGSEVSMVRPGDEVFFFHGGLGMAQGNYAEYAVLDQRFLAHKPRNVGWAEAGAAPLVCITAWEALYEIGQLSHGQRVLIHGGAGGVGHVAVQLAALRGARVCATVRRPEQVNFVHGLGAERVIVTEQEDFVAAVRSWSQGERVALALDTQGGEVFARTVEALAYYGTLVTLLDVPLDAAVWKEARVRNLKIGFELMLTPQLRGLAAQQERQTRILRDCARLMESGVLKLRVGARLPLREAAEAHRRLESGGLLGKVVLHTRALDGEAGA